MATQSKKPLFLFIFRYQQNTPDPTPEEMQQVFGAWMGWMKDMKAKGQYLAGDPLGDDGKVLRGPRGGKVTDGPYAESKEIVGGYMVIAADNLAHATTIAKDCPGLNRGGIVEVRSIDLLPEI